MSTYNWLEQETITKGYNTKRHFWHSYLDSRDLVDLQENWPVIYNSSYHRELNRKQVYNWVGEFKNHLQQNWIADGGLTNTEE